MSEHVGQVPQQLARGARRLAVALQARASGIPSDLQNSKRLCVACRNATSRTARPNFEGRAIERMRAAWRRPWASPGRRSGTAHEIRHSAHVLETAGGATTYVTVLLVTQAAERTAEPWRLPGRWHQVLGHGEHGGMQWASIGARARGGRTYHNVRAAAASP